MWLPFLAIKCPVCKDMMIITERQWHEILTEENRCFFCSDDCITIFNHLDIEWMN